MLCRPTDYICQRHGVISVHLLHRLLAADLRRGGDDWVGVELRPQSRFCFICLDCAGEQSV